MPLDVNAAEKMDMIRRDSQITFSAFIIRKTAYRVSSTASSSTTRDSLKVPRVSSRGKLSPRATLLSAANEIAFCPVAISEDFSAKSTAVLKKPVNFAVRVVGGTTGVDTDPSGASTVTLGSGMVDNKVGSACSCLKINCALVGISR